ALITLIAMVGLTAIAAAQTQPVVIKTTKLPKAYLRQAYQVRLEAQGGILPLHWQLKEGKLPAGTILQEDGLLAGTPSETGEFRFTVTVTDSERPASQRDQQLSLVVVAPLLARWGRYPKVNGQRIEGSIIVSNQTDDEFDLTAIVLAVA